MKNEKILTVEQIISSQTARRRQLPQKLHSKEEILTVKSLYEQISRKNRRRKA